MMPTKRKDKTMKKIIPLLAAMLLVAGCGNNSTGNQANPMNSSSAEPSSSSGATNPSVSGNELGNGPSTDAATNTSATNSNEMETNSAATTNQNPSP